MLIPVVFSIKLRVTKFLFCMFFGKNEIYVDLFYRAKYASIKFEVTGQNIVGRLVPRQFKQTVLWQLAKGYLAA